MTKPYKCRVEYLESTGTQYIDTGIMGNGEFNIKYGLYANSIGSGSDIFAGARSSTQHLNLGQAADNGQFTIGYLNQYWQESRNFAINTRYDIEISYKSGEQYAIINGTKGSSKTYTGTEQTDLTIYLFKRHHYGTDNVGGLQGRIYYFTIKQNDVLVRDFIPVLDNSGRPAMYDQVSGKLFYNKGTGEFTYGRQIIPVEYLESTGTQYIDTGLNPTDEYGYRIKNTYTAGGGEQCAIGCMDSGNRFVGIYTGGPANAISGAWGDYVGFLPNYPWTTGTILDVKGNYKNNRKLIIDGTEMKDISDVHISGTIENTVYLFARHYGTNITKMQGKIYGVEITNGTEVIANFIPCIDENHVPFMFDTVSGSVYLNAGTGQFKVGPNVEKFWGGKKLRRRLALMLANLKKPRKYYCELEYLESTGTQYIDTGILPSEDLRTKVVQAYTGTSIAKNSSILGSNGNGNLRYWINYDNHFEVGYGNFLGTNVVVQPNEVNTIDFNYIKNGSHYFSFNGTEYTTSGTPNTQYNIILFGRVVMNGAPILSPQRIYNVQFIRNDVLIGDFIPVLDWDMKPCLFDRVTEQLFYNQATSGDDFLFGRQIHYVDYLESTGTQWIDTGVSIDTSTDKIDMDFELVDTRLYKWFFGEYDENKRIGLGSGDGENKRNYLYQQSATKVNDSEMYGARHNFYVDQTGGYLNGTKIRSYVSFAATSSIYLFNLNIDSASDYKCASKIYKYKHYRNNALIRDFIAMVDEAGVGALFDRVTHTIFDNGGTGAFAYPPVELEYIETDGKAYINTGYTPSGSTETEITTMLKLQNTSRFMFGCRTNNGQDIYACLSHSSNRIGYRVGTGGYLYSSGYDELNTKHTYKIANGVFYRDDEVINTTCEGATASPNSPLALLTVNTNNLLDTAQTFVGNLYSCTVKENNTLVRDFIPVFKDGQAGVLDKVNNVFYPSSGNGTFVAGAIVEPEYE